MSGNEIIVIGVIIFLLAWWKMNFIYALGLLAAIPVAFLLLNYLLEKTGFAAKAKEAEMKRAEAEGVKKLALETKLGEEMFALHQRVIEITKSHLPALQRKYREGVYKDEFGVEKREKWDDALAYFFKEVVYPNMNPKPLISAYGDLYPENMAGAEAMILNVARLIEDEVEESLSKIKQNESEIEIPVGIEFESYCAGEFRSCGWSVEPTKVVGDQGVDLLAKKESILLAVQCKKHRSPVGNSAVQEVVAGKIHYHADFAVVISNSGFTKSARELAASNEVILLHPEEIHDLEERLV